MSPSHIDAPTDPVQTILVIELHCHWPIFLGGGLDYLISSLTKVKLLWGRSGSSLEKWQGTSGGGGAGAKHTERVTVHSSRHI